MSLLSKSLGSAVNRYIEAFDSSPPAPLVEESESSGVQNGTSKTGGKVSAHGYSLRVDEGPVKARIVQSVGKDAYPLKCPDLPLLATKHYAHSDPGSDKCVRVALHGWGGTGAIFRDLALEFSKKSHDNRACDFVAVDLPGHGNSGAPSDFPYDNPVAYVIAVHALIQQLKLEYGVEKVGLIGHSMGGGIALFYSLLFPEDLDRLDLMSPWTSEKIPLTNGFNRLVVAKLKPDGMNSLMRLSSGKEGRKIIKGNPEVLKSFSQAFDKNAFGPRYGYVSHNMILTETLGMRWRLLEAVLAARGCHKKGGGNCLPKDFPINIYRADSMDVVVPNRFLRRLTRQIDPDGNIGQTRIPGVGHQTPLAAFMKTDAQVRLYSE